MGTNVGHDEASRSGEVDGAVVGDAMLCPLWAALVPLQVRPVRLSESVV